MDVLNSLAYGNPNKEVLDLIVKESFLDSVFMELKNEPIPSNDSELTKDELNEIVDSIAAVSDEENQEYLKRYKAYDKNLSQTIVSIFKEENIDVENYCTEIAKDLKPLISKLKYHFQRPRPYQLAYAYKLKLFPYKSSTDDSPSLPSGHTLQAFVILNVIGNKHPQVYKFCKEIIEDIANSRVYLGLHYPSDNDFAKLVGSKILKNPEFTKKYGI